MKLPKTMVFDGRDGSQDRTVFYLAALNSHDGSSAWRALLTPVRIVCANTQSAAIGSAKASFSIRHTGGAKASIAEARAALKLTWRYIDAFEAEAAALYAAPMDTDDMRRFANKLLDVDAASTRPRCVTDVKRPPASSNCGPARPPSPRSREPGGRPTTPSPNTSTISFPSVERGRPRRPAKRAPCATSALPAAPVR